MRCAILKREGISMSRKGHDIGKEREQVVANYLESLGFSSISVANGHGPDIICWKANRKYLIEVKPLVETGCSWLTRPVSKNRQSDDLIAILFPDNSVLLMPMAEHLSLTTKWGMRSMTQMVRERCPTYVRKPFPRTVPGFKGTKRARAEIIAVLQSRGEDVA